jgi:hypothetical protein
VADGIPAARLPPELARPSQTNSTTTAPTTTPPPASPKGHAPEGDVKINLCEVNTTARWADPEITITNHSSKTSNYAVQVEFVDAKGTRLDEGLAATSNLKPGQASKVTAQGTAQISGKVTCRVTDVTRYTPG